MIPREQRPESIQKRIAVEEPRVSGRARRLLQRARGRGAEGDASLQPAPATVAGGGAHLDAGGGDATLASVYGVVEIEEAATRATQEREQRQGPCPATHWLFTATDEPREVARAEVADLLQHEGNVVWVDLNSYTEHDLRELGGSIGLHRVALHSAVSQWQRPRLDGFDDQFFVSTTIARLDPVAYRVYAGQLDLFVGRNFLVSAHKQPLPFAERVLARARQGNDQMHGEPAFLLYILLDELLAYYEQLHEQLRVGIEVLEHRALTDDSSSFLADLVSFKRYVFALTQLADQHRQIFAAFLRPDFHFVSGNEVEVYYRDLEARLARLLDQLYDARDAVTGAFDIYVSRASHQTNQIIKVLTMISAMLLPSTLIVGFIGTNFRGVPIYSPVAFFLMLLGVCALTVVFIAIFRRRGWL